MQKKAVDDARRTITFVASSDAIDSYGETLDQKTWKLDRYKANPVVLFAHNDRDLPIGRAETVGLNAEGKLEIEVRFAAAEANPKAEQCFQLAKDDILNGASVGFNADKAERVTENGRVFKRLTGLDLYEISLVPVPANPETLAKMRARAAALAAGDQTMGFTPEQMQQICDALGLASDASPEDIVAALVAAKTEEDTEPPAQEPGGGEAAAVDPEAVAAKSALLRETGATTTSGAIERLVAFKRSHIVLEAERERIAAEQASLEATERRNLVAELVVLGKETPATAWSKGADGTPDGKTPKGSLATMPIAELKDRVESFRAATPAAKRAAVRPPARSAGAENGDPDAVVQTLTVEGKTVELTARDLAICAETNCDPKTFALLKSRRAPKTTNR